MQRMKNEANGFANQDKNIALRVNALNELEDLLGNVRIWINQNKGTDDQRKQLKTAIEAQEDWLTGHASEQITVYKDRTKQISAMWNPIK